MRILKRDETPLVPQRGIATAGGKVVALQVQFRSGPYPDKMLPDGGIEHIGEGLSGRQRAARGNKAMLNAEETMQYIPVYEKVGTNAYRYLGEYVVESHTYGELDSTRKPDWLGYRFRLVPADR